MKSRTLLDFTLCRSAVAAEQRDSLRADVVDGGTGVELGQHGTRSVVRRPVQAQVLARHVH